MKKPLIEDISTLAFPSGAIRPMTESRYNYISLLQKGLANLGVNYPSQDIVLPETSDIASYTGNATTIFVDSLGTGGQFDFYDGADLEDGGMVFTNANGNKYQRVTDGTTINPRWYGAVSDDSGTPFDSLPAFTAAIAYIESHPEFDTLFIPYDESGDGYYKISATITINSQIRILGEGSINYPKTKIRVPFHTTVFNFEAVLGEDPFSVEVENIYLYSGVDGAYDTSKHAIISSVVCLFKNITIEEFDGDGIHINASLADDDNNYGNASNSRLEDLSIFYCNNGIYIQGGDANTILLLNCNPSQNRRWGIFDNSLLGICIIKPHMAFDGAAVPGAKTVVSYGGLLYAAIPGHDGYFGDSGTNINKQPDLNLGTYWQVVQEPIQELGAWSAVETYYSGGPICIRGDSAWTNIFYPYTEAFQPPIYLNNRSKVDGGDNGAGVVGGAFWHVLYGEQQLQNAGLVLQKYLMVGTTTYDPASQAKIYNDYTISGSRVGLKTEGSTADIHNEIKNTSTTFSHGLSTTDYQMLIGGVLKATLNTNGFDITGDRLRIRTDKTPANATDTGIAGEICSDANYIYKCVATNQWKRISLTAW